MKHRPIVLQIAIAVAAAGCVAAPVNRTYFEPSPADGTPTRSESCTWQRTAKDQLERKIDDLVISVAPEFNTGRPFGVYVKLSRTAQVLHLDPSRVELHVTGFESVLRPLKADARDAPPYFYKTISYQFQALPTGAQEIAVTFLPGFLQANDQNVELSPFRFRKTTKLDMYYGSINC